MRCKWAKCHVFNCSSSSDKPNRKNHNCFYKYWTYLCLLNDQDVQFILRKPLIPPVMSMTRKTSFN